LQTLYRVLQSLCGVLRGLYRVLQGCRNDFEILEPPIWHKKSTGEKCGKISATAIAVVFAVDCGISVV
jgi:hypothetical protein